MLKPQFCKRETESSNPIPVDLLINIFTSLRAKSIARFHCVSKFWASYILRRRDFTELFLIKSCTRPLLLFTLEAGGKLFCYSTPQPQNPEDNSSLVATTSYKSFPKKFPSYTSTPVCGLVLYHGWKKRVRVVCNPATGEFLTLPKVVLKENNALAKSHYGDTIANEKIVGMYLGYDPKAKQFKVLCMTSLRRYDIREITHRVLTLGPGKLFWRPVEEGNFHFLKTSQIMGDICIHGVIYFGARTLDYYSMIVCFNVGSEKFSFINTNEDMSCSYHGGGYLNLFSYKGRLCLLHQKYRSLDRLMFWVLEDDENHKWSKHVYVLPPLEEEDMITYTRFVGMTVTGEFVWSSSSYNGPPHSLYLSFYNLETGTFRKVNIQGFDEFNQHTIKVYLDYVENVKWLM